MERGADGIGLFRTEPFYMAAKHFPQDKEFAHFCLTALSRHEEVDIDVRLLDIGADKNPIYLHLPPEPIPSWDGEVCAYCVSIPNSWNRSCGLCWKCLNNLILGF
jgi:signal transduction protein with GAF and PtsI domain